MDDAGLQNSAILLLSVGEEEAAQVMRHLSPKEVQRIGTAMSQLAGVTRDRIEDVLLRFEVESERHTSLGMDTDGYLRAVLTRALGDDRAAFLLDRILQGGESSGIESLKWMDAASVAELLGSEHPQIIASVLVHLERDQASEVLAELQERTRNDVLLRIATLDSIQPTALRELNDVLEKLLSGGAPVRKRPLGGVRTAAEIMNFMNASVETAVLDAVREHDADLAQQIMDEMFVFENLLDLDDRSIQALLREVQSESLIVALRGAPESLRDKIFRNMSQRAAEMLRDDLEAKGPVRVSEVEAEQKEILKIVRRMAEEGTVAIGGKADNAYV
ncbi:MAG: flagellar motor switch protein G [Betaproteobacteria bacterium]|nr:MAG: flagellar motor switch protein G [Betaproteobacteria bacterium]